MTHGRKKSRTGKHGEVHVLKRAMKPLSNNAMEKTEEHITVGMPQLS